MDDDVIYFKVNEFQYLGAMLSVKNYWLREIGVRISKTERTLFTLSVFLKVKTPLKKN